MRDKKDIIFLCQYFYPEYISSATLPFDTAKALNKEGFSIGVLCGYPKEYNNTDDSVSRTENYDGIDITRIKYIQVKRTGVLGRLVNYFSFMISVGMRILYFRRYKSVIVYSNPPILPLVAWLANRLFGTKIVFVSYDIYPEIAIRTEIISEGSFISKAMNVINRLLFKNVTKVIALSSEMKNVLLSSRKDLVADRVKVIPNWYQNKNLGDVENSYLNPILNRIDAEHKLVISYLGNMGVAQDLTTLLCAIKHLKNNSDISFVFAGHGNKLPIIKKIIDEESLQNVFVYDYLHGDDFNDVLNISDVFIVSMEAGLDGLAVPSKTYSYMMSGKPIIAIMEKSSDIAKDLVENNAGFSIGVGDTDSLVKAINILKSDLYTRTIMGKNAYSLFVEKYTTEKCTAQYVSLMHEILEEH